MGLSVSNIPTLKTIAADDKRLRFVESEKAWFWSDPSGIDVPDDVQIITPNAGTGRWYKLYAREVTPSDWTWTQITSAPTTVYANNKSGFICNASSNNIITVTLPDTPLFGHTVRVKKVDAAGWNRRVVIARNGKNIEGAASNIALTVRGADVELLYVDNTIGWTVTSNLPYSTVSGTSVTLTRVSDGDANGVFNYIATNRLVTSWTNPVDASLVGTYFYAAGLSGLSIRPTMVDRGNSTAWSYGLLSTRIIMKINIDTERFLRLTTLSIRNDSTGTAWRGFNVYGTNIPSGELSGSVGIRNVVNADWDVLARFTSNTSMSTAGGGQWGTYQIDAAKFYNTFYIEFSEALANEANYGYIRVGEIEMYGDLIW